MFLLEQWVSHLFELSQGESGQDLVYINLIFICGNLSLGIYGIESQEEANINYKNVEERGDSLILGDIQIYSWMN